MKTILGLQATTFVAAIVVATTVATAAQVDPTAVPMVKMVPEVPDVQVKANEPTPVGANLKVSSSDILNKPSALINKNTLATDNKVRITNSNIVFMQDDKLRIKHIVDELLANEKQEKDTMMVGQDLLRAISVPDTNQDLLAKASVTIASARTGDRVALDKAIVDLIRAVFQFKQTREAAIQKDSPRHVILLHGIKDILRQPTAVVNKNMVMTDSQVAISDSQLASTSKDTVSMSDDAKVADNIVPGSLINMKDDPTTVRVGFLYQKKPTKDTKTQMSDDEYDDDDDDDDDEMNEQFGFWRAPMGFGWRYPLSYWNAYGRFMYPRACGLGVRSGQYFYC